jgi:hypothetical protein
MGWRWLCLLIHSTYHAQTELKKQGLVCINVIEFEVGERGKSSARKSKRAEWAQSASTLSLNSFAAILRAAACAT